eukprot:CAMPEP_0179712194 /NCGR_PEP_ID=MMETSP0937-20121108/7381_1 /TAXON_ID=548131 ORGANISM="Ostreococcus mediterraneus, Strain clade-D-RCC2593" /NCGR_SAMPLE_ID=MMETSP0937 /ASSEMBLY_ACC=CAM_ASM_000575 /LENGTH=67 /DNA_ID=CAMNT_0021585779 /DNA_START=652 /DNA_END=852 /DNA_ORIENTATION=+
MTLSVLRPLSFKRISRHQELCVTSCKPDELPSGAYISRSKDSPSSLKTIHRSFPLEVRLSNACMNLA